MQSAIDPSHQLRPCAPSADKEAQRKVQPDFALPLDAVPDDGEPEPLNAGRANLRGLRAEDDSPSSFGRIPQDRRVCDDEPRGQIDREIPEESPRIVQPSEDAPAELPRRVPMSGDIPEELPRKLPPSEDIAVTNGSGMVGIWQSDLLPWRSLQKPLGFAFAVALSESSSSQPAPGRVRQRWEEASLFPGGEDADTMDAGQAGCCGFTATIHWPPPSRGGPPAFPAAAMLASDERNRSSGSTVPELGMCHHYTWDGQHCVEAGLSSEHANRCAGCLCEAGYSAEVEFCRAGFHRACAASTDNGSRHLREIVCGPPLFSMSGACRVETCPFLAEGSDCPYMIDESTTTGLVFHL